MGRRRFHINAFSWWAGPDSYISSDCRNHVATPSSGAFFPMPVFE
jgi:hypothetical protein